MVDCFINMKKDELKSFLDYLKSKEWQKRDCYKIKIL